jgi:CheY-like chemotaxis protein
MPREGEQEGLPQRAVTSRSGKRPRDAAVALRILIVDDDPRLRSALARSLRPHDVHVAANGADAIAAIEQGPAFDVVLMDLEMPVMNGRDTFVWLSTHRPALAERTLIVSGGAKTDDLRAWLDGLDVEQRMVKPLDLAALRERVERLGRAPR